MNEVGAAFEDLSHALRVLLEADANANRLGLMQVDRAEAVGNIEIALTAVLNAFHSLYDAIEKHVSPPPIDWYATPALATIVALRNARHHNLARKVRTLYTYHVQESESPGKMLQYVLIDFPPGEDGAGHFEVYMSWGDMKSLLELPRSESRLRPETCESIRQYLSVSRYAEAAQHYGVPESRVFFNLIPLVVNAAATITPVIKSYVRPQSLESRIYLGMFSNMPLARTSEPEVACGPFALPS